MVRRSGAPEFWGGGGFRGGGGGELVSLAGKLRRRRATEACTSAAKLPSFTLPLPPLGLAFLPTGLHSLLTSSLVLLLLAHVGE